MQAERRLINLKDMLRWDNTILDDYTLPSAITITPDYSEEPTYTFELNHDTMSSAIMLHLGLMTPLYQEPDMFKSALDYWFIIHKWNIEHLMMLAAQNYNPLENYNRWEHLRGTDTLSGTDTERHSGSDVDTATDRETEVHSGADTTTNTTSAMNSSTYQPDNKSVLDYGETITTNSSKTDTLEHGESIATLYGKVDTGNHNNHLHGNIGVTTTQQMFNQEIDLVKSFNIYDVIVQLIEKDLFLGVY